MRVQGLGNGCVTNVDTIDRKRGQDRVHALDLGSTNPLYALVQQYHRGSGNELVQFRAYW
ncbi:hypothetical protein Tdes44962_MAKER08554 [Teratosphaeria destructans]|uniref:Uncharacterized protein n=1 Tax=Teratosphaeria destructans TaxID=418781 RepID=A0A9W7SW78_9PEZI|nr:hypothetical protein Tdes44962_MAKER08554 [Teratosphaeria destructans]